MARLRVKQLTDFAVAKTLLEAIDTTTRVNHFLLTSVERVALRADVHVEVFFVSGADSHCVATRTGGGHFVVFWVNTLFHDQSHYIGCDVLCTATS